jgi:hypothetical protein
MDVRPLQHSSTTLQGEISLLLIYASYHLELLVLDSSDLAPVHRKVIYSYEGPCRYRQHPNVIVAKDGSIIFETAQGSVGIYAEGCGVIEHWLWCAAVHGVRVIHS